MILKLHINWHSYTCAVWNKWKQGDNSCNNTPRITCILGIQAECSHKCVLSDSTVIQLIYHISTTLVSCFDRTARTAVMRLVVVETGDQTCGDVSFWNRLHFMDGFINCKKYTFISINNAFYILILLSKLLLNSVANPTCPSFSIFRICR